MQVESAKKLMDYSLEKAHGPRWFSVNSVPWSLCFHKEGTKKKGSKQTTLGNSRKAMH